MHNTLLIVDFNMPNTFTSLDFSMLMHNTLLIVDSIVHPTKPIERREKKTKKTHMGDQQNLPTLVGC
jgi:hypothetical protein